MSRIMRMYKRLLDLTLLVSYGLMLLLVTVLIWGMVIQAYDFSNSATAYFKPEYGYVRSILVFLVAAIVIFVVAARVFLSFVEHEEKLETADDFRRKAAKSSSKKKKRVAFNQTDTYKKFAEKTESVELEKELTKKEAKKKVVVIKEAKVKPIKKAKVKRVKKVKEEQIEEIKEVLVEESIEQVTEQPTQQPTKQPTEQPFKVTNEEPIEEPIEEPVEEPVEETIEEPFVYHIYEPIEEEIEQKDEVKGPTVFHIDEEVYEEPIEEISSPKETTRESIMVTSDIGPKTTTKKFYTRLNKSELNKIVATVSDISVSKAKLFVNTLLDVIKDELVEGNEVKIDDFGKFDKKIVKEKKSRNPRTGESILVPKHGAVKFTAFKQFKDDITNDVSNTSIRYLLTETEKDKLSEDEVQNELIKEEIIKEHVAINVVAPKPVVKIKKKSTSKKTKADIIEYIGESTDLSKNKANIFLKYYSEVIKDSLAKKEDVNIEGFGKFTTIDIPTKNAVNPSTGAKISVKGHTQVRMRFEKSFKEIINQK